MKRRPGAEGEPPGEASPYGNMVSKASEIEASPLRARRFNVLYRIYLIY